MALGNFPANHPGTMSQTGGFFGNQRDPGVQDANCPPQLEFEPPAVAPSDRECGMCAITTTSTMHYVGDGCGEYVPEVNYRYVGHGMGHFMVQRRVGYFWPVLACTVVLSIIVTVLLFLIPGPTTTTYKFSRSTPPPRGRRECLFWGDPHVKTFDGARPSFYGSGEFWIIKNDDVKVQGRYLGTKYTHGLAATNKIVVSGDFINGHKIEVGPVEGGHISVDDVNVLPELGGIYDLRGFGVIRYNGIGELVDEAQSNYTKRIVHMDLPNAVTITVYRWSNYLDLKLEMPKMVVDGSCGNWNDDPMDDTTEEIFKRIGARIAPGENIFDRRTEVEVTPEMVEMLQTKCPMGTMRIAEQECHSTLASEMQDSLQMQACLYDVCFGDNEHALRTAKTFA